jgi:predicted ribosomally synthesized peptide with SipW-like signal peptide
VRRSILLSLLVIGAAVSLIGGASLALFNDIDHSAGNTFAGGSMDLCIYDGASWENDDIGPLVTLTDMVPSEWENITVYFKNCGTDPGDMYVHFGNVTDSHGVFTEPERDLDPGNTVNDISNHIDVDINGSIKGKLRDIASNWYKVADDVAPGDQISFYLSFHLQDVTSVYEKDVATFNIDGQLTQ